jgi:hypothetical protein
VLKVCNLEFGLNIIPETDIKNLINGILFYKKTPFKVGDFPYFKKTDATTYKFLKAYAKGLQFADFKILKVGIQNNRITVWVATEVSRGVAMPSIYITGTGWEDVRLSVDSQYLDTLFFEDGTVWHVFEM